MATRKYSVPRGAPRGKLLTETVGSAVTSGALVDITVDMGISATKKDVLEAIGHIARHIRRNKWTPA